MSAALKRPAPTPAPFPTPERAALGHAIVAAADANARRAALERAIESATTEVRAAVVAVEAATARLETSKSDQARHLVDTAQGKIGTAPMTPRECRNVLDETKDRWEAAREARQALQASLTDEKLQPNWSQMRLDAAAYAVIRAEMHERGVALAARVAKMQCELVEIGSSLKWLAEAGAFPLVTDGSLHGQPADLEVRHTIQRMETQPTSWAMSRVIGEAPFAAPIGAIAWEAAFQALLRDASTPLPLSVED